MERKPGPRLGLARVIWKYSTLCLRSRSGCRGCRQQARSLAERRKVESMTINASPVALLVHAHSEADSFVTAMRDRIAATLSGSDYEITHSDLYGMNWNPVLSPTDFGTRSEERRVGKECVSPCKYR